MALAWDVFFNGYALVVFAVFGFIIYSILSDAFTGRVR